MTIVAAGSIATDHLMVFPGRFSDQLVDGKLHHISLSFLADELHIRRGGVGANIAFGLGVLGLRPALVGAVGADFAEYRNWLEAHGVDTAHVRVSTERHTARFVCTTDAEQNQIATFYAGAMGEAGEIDIGETVAAVGDVDIVVISPDDPAAMLRHTRYCRAHGVPFAADPSQQMARMPGPDIRELVDGATYLFTNAYEADLLRQKTGWSTEEVLDRVGVWVRTEGADGVTITGCGEEPVRVGVVPAAVVADPTGVGDAFRAGFLAGRIRGLGLVSAARLGSAMAALVVETVGTQQYDVEPSALRTRIGQYSDTAAAEIEHALFGIPTPSAPVEATA
ncbi:MAG TPA: carbohydrate kinase family protein [Pseudonocardiaceae bacterium]|jgi:adenosine kinase